jgi:peptide/nickel transport system permease protein
MVGRAEEVEPSALAPEWAPAKTPSLWRSLGRFFVRKPLGAFGVFVIAVLIVMAVGAPVLARYGVEETFEVPNPTYDPSSLDAGVFSPNAIDKQAAPTIKHWFGTDDYGRDTYARIVWGTRRTLKVGLLSLTMGTIVGILIGLTSAYFSGLVDTVVQRFMDTFQSFPALLFLLLLVTVFEPSEMSLTVGLAIVSVPSISRIVRSVVLQTREMPFVESARLIGASDLRIMVRHILPNVMAPIIVIFTIGVGAVILAEASVSFLGFGPPGISWGQMLDKGRLFVLTSPWLALFSGGAITMAVLAFNLAGDALRDVLDPRLRM